MSPEILQYIRIAHKRGHGHTKIAHDLGLTVRETIVAFYQLGIWRKRGAQRAKARQETSFDSWREAAMIRNIKHGERKLAAMLRSESKACPPTNS